MSFSIDLQELRERASRRIANPATVATVATLLPDEGSKVAALAGLQCTTDHAPDADRWCWPHSGALNTAELNAFAARRDRLMRWGYAEQDADDMAERLTLRDRERDDRRLCIECRHLAHSGRCKQAALGRMPGVDRRLEPVRTILMRCEHFAEQGEQT